MHIHFPRHVRRGNADDILRRLVARGAQWLVGQKRFVITAFHNSTKHFSP
jgi:hypothetical protein